MSTPLSVPCPKCEGRGFIRTYVDGQRDSEPCSYCRMSGKAGPTPLSEAELERVRYFHKEQIGMVCLCGEIPCSEGQLLATIDALTTERDAAIMAFNLGHKVECVTLSAKVDALRTVVRRQGRCGRCHGSGKHVCYCDGQTCRDWCLERSGNPCIDCDGDGLEEWAREALGGKSLANPEQPHVYQSSENNCAVCGRMYDSLLHVLALGGKS